MRRQSELANKTKLKKAMSVYESAVSKMVIENGINSTQALQNWSGNNCSNSGAYFKKAEDNGCIFKTPDGVWWDISNIDYPVVAFDRDNLTVAEAENFSSNKAYHQVTSFDSNGSLRINDVGYEDNRLNNNVNHVATITKTNSVKKLINGSSPKEIYTNLKSGTEYAKANCNGNDYNLNDNGTFECTCLAQGTLITLSDGSTKEVQDINFDDELLVWDFDNGVLASAKPLWIKIAETTTRYNLLTFSDGRILKTINQHRIFNKEAGKYTYPMTDDTPIGTTTLLENGSEVTLVKKK